MAPIDPDKGYTYRYQGYVPATGSTMNPPAAPYGYVPSTGSTMRQKKQGVWKPPPAPSYLVPGATAPAPPPPPGTRPSWITPALNSLLNALRRSYSEVTGDVRRYYQGRPWWYPAAGLGAELLNTVRGQPGYYDWTDFLDPAGRLNYFSGRYPASGYMAPGQSPPALGPIDPSKGYSTIPARFNPGGYIPAGWTPAEYQLYMSRIYRPQPAPGQPAPPALPSPGYGTYGYGGYGKRRSSYGGGGGGSRGGSGYGGGYGYPSWQDQVNARYPYLAAAPRWFQQMMVFRYGEQ